MTKQNHEKQKVKALFLEKIEFVIDKPESWVAKETRVVEDEDTITTYQMEVKKIMTAKSKV